MSDVSVMEDASWERHQYGRMIRVAGSDPIPCTSFTNKGKQYIPELLVLNWKGTSAPEVVTVSGPVLKKDGTPGQNTHRQTYWLPGNEYAEKYGEPDNVAPMWMQELIGVITLSGYEDHDERFSVRA